MTSESNAQNASKRPLIKPKSSTANRSPELENTTDDQANSGTSHQGASMASQAQQNTDKKVRKPSYEWVLSDLIFLGCIGLSFYLAIIFAGYSPQDPGFVLVDEPSSEVANYGGETGAWLASFLLYIFGIFGYLLPIGITIGGWMTLKNQPENQKTEVVEQDYVRFGMSLLGVFLFVSTGAAMTNLFMAPEIWLAELPYSTGGVWGYELSNLLENSIDLLATTLLLLGLWAWSLSLLLNRSWMTIFEATGIYTEKAVIWFYRKVWKGEKTRKVIQVAQQKIQQRRQPKTGDDSRNMQKPKSIQQRLAGFMGNLKNGPSLKVFSKRRDLQSVNQLAEKSIDPKLASQTVLKMDKAEIIGLAAEPIKEEQQLPLTEIAGSQSSPQAETSSNSAVDELLAAEQKQNQQPKPLEKPEQSPASGTESSPEDLLPDVSRDGFSVEIGQRAQSIEVSEIKPKPKLPGLDLLEEPPVYEEGYTEEELTDLSYLLEKSLAQFNIEVSVESVQPGPVVTRFEILPAPGIKVSKINNLAKDLARVMMVESVRVVDVIVGKSVIGIEIPNKIREVVSFREVLSSKAFQDSKSPLSIGLGKDISGEPIVADIAKMPHLLVAGTTGAGKSVGVNSMILSMLYKSTAEEVRMILIDPKMLELSIYEDIPHLLSPVVTDMNDAANALRWCVFEMDRRYELMAKLKVRNIAGFNLKVKDAIEKGKPIIDPLHEQLKSYGYEAGEAPPTLEPLPFIVVVIDEFADMIMTVGKEVEQLIARLAQKARAAGIHLILATQRPSVNVITGLIKANIPTRIAFMVNTKIDSRTILEQGGAEQLLGRGDMLYMPPGSGNPMRVHGAFMTDEEVNTVAEFVKSQGEPQYLKAITEAPPSDDDGKGGTGNAEDDPLYDEVVAFITEKRKVSVSLLQRHFSIGYNRSARIVEGLEAAGLISAGRGGNNVREVLVPKRDELDDL